MGTHLTCVNHMEGMINDGHRVCYVGDPKGLENKDGDGIFTKWITSPCFQPQNRAQICVKNQQEFRIVHNFCDSFELTVDSLPLHRAC